MLTLAWWHLQTEAALPIIVVASLAAFCCTIMSLADEVGVSLIPPKVHMRRNSTHGSNSSRSGAWGFLGVALLLIVGIVLGFLPLSHRHSAIASGGAHPPSTPTTIVETRPSNPGQSSAGVRMQALLTAYQKAYQDRNIAALTGLLDPQVDRWTIGGVHYCGRASVLAEYRRDFQEPIVSYILNDERIMVDSGQSAAATSLWTLYRGRDQPESGHVKFTASDADGVWRLTDIDTRTPGQTLSKRPYISLPPEPPVSGGEVQEVLARYRMAYKNARGPALDSLLASDVVRRASDGCTYLGHNAVLASYKQIFDHGAASAFRLTIKRTRILPSGVEVRARWKSTGLSHPIRFVVVSEADMPRLALIDAGPSSH